LKIADSEVVEYVEHTSYNEDQSPNIYNSTIGAGDTFIAGILFGLLCHYNEWEWARKLRFANELAGRKVVQEGFQGLGQVMTCQMR
jgi:ketohexokinase